MEKGRKKEKKGEKRRDTRGRKKGVKRIKNGKKGSKREKIKKRNNRKNKVKKGGNMGRKRGEILKKWWKKEKKGRRKRGKKEGGRKGWREGVENGRRRKQREKQGKTTKFCHSRQYHAQNKLEVARVHRRRDCAERENHTGSQYGPGIAALAVLRNSHVFQTIPHIVGLVALCTGTWTHWLSKSVNSFTFNMYETFFCRPPPPGIQDHTSNCAN